MRRFFTSLNKVIYRINKVIYSKGIGFESHYWTDYQHGVLVEVLTSEGYSFYFSPNNILRQK